MKREAQSKGATLKQWKAHIRASQKFRGSDAEYCRQQGVNPSTFHTYKRKLGLTKGTPKSRASQHSFVRIEPKAERGSEQDQGQTTEWPDPQWVAKFLKELFK